MVGADGAAIELAHVRLGEGWDGALHPVELLLESGRHQQAGQLALGLQLGRIPLLEHGDGVQVVAEEALASRAWQAVDVLSGSVVAGAQLPLHPVPHDLHGGAAALQQVGGLVPLQAGVFFRHIGAQLLEAGQHPHHVGAGQGGAVLLQEGLAIEGLAPFTECHRLEQHRQLPGLVADGQRRDALRLELLRHRHEVLPVGGGRQPQPLEQLAVEPQPVDPVDAGGHRHQGAVLAEGVTDHGGELRVPAEVFGHGAEVAQETQAGPLVQLIALEVRRLRRIGRQRPAFQHRHGALAAAALHREVVPLVALLGPFRLEHFHRLGLATGGPPVQHLHLGGGDGQGEQGDNGKREQLHTVTALIEGEWPVPTARHQCSTPTRWEAATGRESRATMANGNNFIL